jgi:hypothetical protein
VLLGKYQTLWILLLKNPHPVHRVQSVPTVMPCTQHEVVERLVSEPEVGPTDYVTPLK